MFIVKLYICVYMHFCDCVTKIYKIWRARTFIKKWASRKLFIARLEIYNIYEFMKQKVEQGPILLEKKNERATQVIVINQRSDQQLLIEQKSNVEAGWAFSNT